ncbi:MAG: lipid-A-disaccharide synthase N-terminal domain-containing protein [Planctomycetes bacterium]|nr:lipid-A-disaccharide synthase N-terminal domain-containing protein [Planctomycetota bacterium]
MVKLLEPFAIIGFLGQAIFGSRFLVQWIASERAKASVVPVSFWYLSLIGTLLTLTYAILIRNPVFILGYLPNSVIYIRNLMLISAKNKPPAAPAMD